uniref:Uncharacterized protein n=1 Tax=Arundo donax TaxID=35708 RepID=A0A0A9ES32_ARUDO
MVVAFMITTAKDQCRCDSLLQSTRMPCLCCICNKERIEKVQVYSYTSFPNIMGGMCKFHPRCTLAQLQKD